MYKFISQMSTRKLKIAYFGSPSFSAYFLEKLLTDKTLPIEVKLVITQEDKPVGRKQILTPSPVKQIATKYQISNIKYQKEIENWKLEIGKLDLALVLAFGKIIPKELLHQPKYGFWNIHYSLLPKYRGPSPTAYALIAGEKKTGVTIFQMDEEIDHGPIIAQ
ncbi:MAG: methionyl-tRNA formyltransferase, partial [Microgenomates group bacterium]